MNATAHFRRCSALFIACGALLLPARAQFIPTGPGTYDYGDNGLWSFLIGLFGYTQTGPQILTFSSDRFLNNGITVNLGGTSPSLTFRSDGNGSQTIRLGDGISINASTGALITIGSAIANEQLRIDLDGNRTFSVAANNTLGIKNAIIGTSSSLTKSGAGLLVLSGLATYDGSTTISGGTLQINTENALPISTAVTIGSGTLDVRFNQTVSTLLGGGTLSFSNGAVFTLNTPVGEYTFSGDITGAGSLVKAGTGTQRLGGTNNYTGTTTVSGGTLQFGLGGTTGTVPGNIINNATLIFSRSDGFGYSGVISGTGNFTLSGGGSFTFSVPQTYGGATILDLGTTLNLGDGIAVNSNILPATTTLSMLAGSKLNVNSDQALAGLQTTPTGSPVAATVAIAASKKLSLNLLNPMAYQGVISGTGALELNSGTFTINGANTYSGGTTINGGTLALAGVDTLLNTGTVLINSAGTLSVGANQQLAAISGLGTVSIGSGKALTLAPTSPAQFDGTISGDGALVKTGSSSLNLVGANLYTGGTTISGGTLTVLNPTGSATGTGLVVVNNGAALEIGGGGGTVGAVSGNIVNDGTVTFARNDATTYAGLLFGNGVLNKSGAGTLTLTGNSPFGGTVNVQSGTLALGDGSANGGLNANIQVLSGATLATNHSAAVTYSGAVSGQGAFIKNGSGTLTLTGANTFSGTATINQGTLVIGAASSLPAVLVSLGSGAELEIANTTSIGQLISAAGSNLEIALTKIFSIDPVSATTSVLTGGVSGQGTFRVAGVSGSSVTLLGDAVHTGGTTIETSSTLRIGSGGNTGSLAGDVTNKGTLQFMRQDGVTFTGLISGAGQVVNTTGTLTLTAANTYSGGTLVTGGKLIVSNSSGSATGTGTVVVNTGALFGGLGSISGGVILNVGGTIGPGDAAIGILKVGATTFGPSAFYAFDINDATGTAGTNWDLLSVSGALTITATSETPFTVSISSLTAQLAPGLLANFDQNQAYSWQLVTTTDGIIGFNANAFHFNASAFQNGFTGVFGISQSGNSLFLNYVPAAIPEPSTYALMLAGLGVVVWFARRKT